MENYLSVDIFVEIFACAWFYRKALLCIVTRPEVVFGCQLLPYLTQTAASGTSLDGSVGKVEEHVYGQMDSKYTNDLDSKYVKDFPTFKFHCSYGFNLSPSEVKFMDIMVLDFIVVKYRLIWYAMVIVASNISAFSNYKSVLLVEEARYWGTNSSLVPVGLAVWVKWRFSQKTSSSDIMFYFILLYSRYYFSVLFLWVLYFISISLSKTFHFVCCVKKNWLM